MERKSFLSYLGISFLSTLFFSGKPPLRSILRTACNDPITPPVPEGPFYKNKLLNRVNIAETQKGVLVDYVFKVEDKDCKPIAGAIVDIWQCNNEGRYSDFQQEHTASEKWLRGYQQTDNNGTCRFTSVFPGWYEGRLTHLHLKVILDHQTVLTTNCFFPKEIEQEVYKNPQYPKGANPITLSQDAELRVDKDSTRHDALIMKVDKDNNGKLIASYTIAIA
jgi:protocatechuate 3,4-dioxygenase beta subunit